MHCEAMLDSMNFPDTPLLRDLFWYFSSNNSGSGVFCCPSQIDEIEFLEQQELHFTKILAYVEKKNLPKKKKKIKGVT